LQQAADDDPHAALHQGALACLQGDPRPAEAAWSAGAGESLSDPVASLFAAIAAFGGGRMIETPYQDEI